MKNYRSILSILSLALLFSFNTQASNLAYGISTPNNSELTSITEQVTDYLNGIDISKLDEEMKVLVDFILTPKGELVILSTNSETFDKVIKNKLNYRTLTNHGLEAGKTYTFPITFRNEN